MSTIDKEFCSMGIRAVLDVKTSGIPSSMLSGISIRNASISGFSCLQKSNLPRHLAVLMLLSSSVSGALLASEFTVPSSRAWTTSQIKGSPEPRPPYVLRKAYPEIQLNQPVVLTTTPSVDLWFAAELDGRVVSFPLKDAGADDVQECLRIQDVRPDATRIYGFTFHPEFEQNHLAYICYITTANEPNGTFVSEFEVDIQDGRPRIKSDSERVLIQWAAGGHNGGCLKFGPDRMLYITTGDADSPSPPDERATGQDISDLLSSILRIDVSRKEQGREYAVPEDNPFVGLDNARSEIWAYGFRNPWKISFDSQTGDLWAGDVGWELWELVYRVQRGGNYGWSIVEGPQSVKPEATRGPTPILPPVTVHPHTEARSVTGGVVYRGTRLADLKGAYIYGDYVTGKMWGLKFNGSRVTWQSQLAETGLAIITFAESPGGEVYVVSYDGGIYQLAENPSAGLKSDFPDRLSETGLFSDLGTLRPAAGVFEYVINSEHWSDGTVSRRFVGIPPHDGTKPDLPLLEVFQKQDLQKGFLKGQWAMPDGTVFVRNIGNPLKSGGIFWLETQILHREENQWHAYSYAWNAEQSEASLVPDEGAQIDRPIQTDVTHAGQWTVPSRTQCMVCHSYRAGNILGFTYGQLDRDIPTLSGPTKNQIEILSAVGLIKTETKRSTTSRKLADPFDETASLTDRARSYLHTNCAHCHRRGGGGTAAFELQHHLDLDKLGIIDQRPSQGSFEIYRPAVVVPGDPYRSILLYRLSKLGRGHMPHLGSSEIDPRALSLIHDWIQQMSNGTVDEARPILSKNALDHEIEQALSTTSGALQLALNIHSNSLTPDIRNRVITAGMRSQAEHIRGLFECFIPANQRPRRFGSSTSIAEILTLEGEASRGKRLFATSQGVQCRSCHKIGDIGRAVGPSLDGIGKKLTRAQLIESILDPSRKIEPKYLPHLVETTAGRVYSGLITDRNESILRLQQADGKTIEVQIEDVEVLAPQQKSLMPELLLRDLTRQQVADLITYLSALQ